MNKFFRLSAFNLCMLIQFNISANVALVDTLIDDKKPFANLFLYNKVASNKSYQSQINPRAISFVEEYILFHILLILFINLNICFINIYVKYKFKYFIYK